MVDKNIFCAFSQKGIMQSFPSVVCTAVSHYNSMQLFLLSSVRHLKNLTSAVLFSNMSL